VNDPTIGAPSFWQALSPADREELSRLGLVRRFPAGSVIVEQEEESDHVLVLLQGCVKVATLTRHGYEAVLALRDAGDLIGEQASVDGRRRSATIYSLTEVETLLVPAARFGAFQSSRPMVDRAVKRTLSTRLREADQTRAEVGADRVAQRLALLLLRLARRYGKKEGDDVVLIQLPLSQDDLAGLVLASKRTVGRILEQWRHRGWVRTGRLRVVITDLSALNELAYS
jgi:CRP/FNR family transcriptional regulator, cyclic AMP receptor protein